LFIIIERDLNIKSDNTTKCNIGLIKTQVNVDKQIISVDFSQSPTHIIKEFLKISQKA
jgi:hypothetical protein